MKYETAIGLTEALQARHGAEAGRWAAMEKALHCGYRNLEDHEKAAVLQLLERARLPDNEEEPRK